MEEQKDIKQTGRPSIYTTELGEEIKQLLAEGLSIRKICELEHMPDKSNFIRWLSENDDFRIQYEAGKEAQMESFADEITDLGMEAIEQAKKVGEKRSSAVVMAYKNHMDNKKWLMSKLKPKKYGDKIDVTSDGKRIETTPVIISDIKPRNTEPKKSK